MAATWSELGRVNIWDLTKQLATVDDQQMLSKYNKENTGNTCTPISTFNGHQQEGYAVDWSKTAPGVSIIIKYSILFIIFDLIQFYLYHLFFLI